MKKLSKFGAFSVLSLAALSLGACSTTSYPGSAQGAPITYKADQGVTQQATLSMPYANSTRTFAQPSRPITAQPLPPIQSQPVMPSAKTFDQSRVDTGLYKHQRIGKRYKIMGQYFTPRHEPGYDKVGTASWYGDKFHGKLTASGEVYDMNDITAAHTTLPLNSMVYVTNLETGKGIMVRVNDRGPFVDGRIIDLSRATAHKLGLFTSGLARVRVQYAGPADPMAAKRKRKPIMKPVAPKIKPAPEAVAEIPQYKPLRDFASPPAQSVALPVKPQFPFQPKTQTPNPLLGLGDRQPGPATAPQSVQTPEGSGPVTLTIKGPVHMASDKNDGTQPKAKFIPAVNYTTLPAEK